MTWGPSRGIAIGGVAFGIIVLVIGVLLLLVNQEVLIIQRFDIWTVCAIGLIIVGLVGIVGAVWARGFVRRGWRQWMAEDWEKPK